MVLHDLTRDRQQKVLVALEHGWEPRFLLRGLVYLRRPRGNGKWYWCSF